MSQKCECEEGALMCPNCFEEEEMFKNKHHCSFCECFVPSERWSNDRCTGCHDRILKEFIEDREAWIKSEKFCIYCEKFLPPKLMAEPSVYEPPSSITCVCKVCDEKIRKEVRESLEKRANAIAAKREYDKQRYQERKLEKKEKAAEYYKNKKEDIKKRNNAYQAERVKFYNRYAAEHPEYINEMK